MAYLGNSSDLKDHRSLRDKRKCPYSDSLETTYLGWVQTPQYFEDCYKIKVLGDPCGHRNAVFFDAVQCGLDGYGSALFAGTNAIFRRAAFDSIGGIKYGTLTEDSFTGFTLNQAGWDSAYFRKDWEGSADERFPLASGLVPESVAATFKQRKRWAQGSCEIFLMDKRKPDQLMDREWWEEFHREHPVELPPPGDDREWKFRFMRRVFFFNTMYYPYHSFAAIAYYVVNIYMMLSGTLPFYLNTLVILTAMVPYILLRGLLNRLAHNTVSNVDAVHGQEMWFALAPIYLWALFDAYYSKITGKHARWANTGGLGRNGSVMEVPNIVIFFVLLLSVVFTLYRFFRLSDFEVAWQWFPGLFFGVFLLAQIWPTVRMSVQEYLGWSYESLRDTDKQVVFFAFATLVAFLSQWKAVYVHSNSGKCLQDDDTGDFCLENAGHGDVL
uniref:Glycosyltransferase 2-like domain-containing protein n=1 Tax=Rhizochromulina marina TaxID=1034831 RepID=A0A7S2RUS2_9STRA